MHHLYDFFPNRNKILECTKCGDKVSVGPWDEQRCRKCKEKEARKLLNRHLRGRKLPAHDIMDCGIPFVDN